MTKALLAIGHSICGAPAGPNTQCGAAPGGLGGALLGGVVGHQSGCAHQGAVIGAVEEAAIVLLTAMRQIRNNAIDNDRCRGSSPRIRARFSGGFSSLHQKRIPSIDSSHAAAARDKAEGAEAQKHKR